MFQDLCYGLRMFAKRLGATFIALLTLSLGREANELSNQLT
jgi:hypothetical protein